LSVTAIVLILFAAVAHASWNLFSKQAATVGTTSFIWLVSVAATVCYAPAAAVVLIVQRPHLTALNWAFMAGTGILQAGYFLFLQNGYRVGDLSLVYPIGRGTGALLAALAGIALLGERPGPAGLTGIVLIVAGVIVLGIPAPARRSPASPALAPVPAAARPVTARAGSAGPPPAAPIPARAAGAEGGAEQVGPENKAAGSAGPPPAAPAPARAASASGQPGTAAPGPAVAAAAAPRRPAVMAITFAGLTGLFIASYTLWDKHAVTTLHTPPLLQGYAAFPIMSLAFAPLALRDRPRLARVWRSYRPQVLGAAFLMPLAYILVLIALSFTAVSAVAPAREVSVLFGVLLGRRLLGEGSLPRRLCGAAAIVAGIIAIALG
jgi:drug/metabolite transporter (DMT)-like permease